jgi:hypothetical protein
MATIADWVGKRETKWRQVLAGQAASGISVRAYCASRRIREPAFYWWRAELARRDAANARPCAAAFVPVIVEPAGSVPPGDIVIELLGGRALRLPASMAVEKVGALVRAIEGAS